MLVILLIFSLCLHLITFYLITILVQRINQMKAEQPVIDNEGITLAMEAYLNDIRHENDVLIERIKALEAGSEQVRPPYEATEQKGEAHHINTLHTEVDNELGKPKQTIKDAKNETPSLPIDQIKDQVEQSTESKILQLHQNGVKIDEIAKKLKLGKGEVEFIITIFNKKQG